MREARERPSGTPWALWALVAVLALGCAWGAVLATRTHDSRARSEAQQDRYAAAMRAASAEAEAFVNVSHETAEADLARIADGATGALEDQYTDGSDRLVAALRRDRTVTTGRVVWTGVVRVDADGATVLVATDGSRSDRGTDGEAAPRDLRLRLRLVPAGDGWLTSQIEQVG